MSWSRLSGFDDGVLVVDDTGFLTKGRHSVGYSRLYSGTLAIMTARVPSGPELHHLIARPLLRQPISRSFIMQSSL